MTNDKLKNLDSENIELELLLDARYMKYSYDFRGYARASIKRRIKHRLSLSGLETISDMRRLVLYETATIRGGVTLRTQWCDFFGFVACSVAQETCKF